MIEQPDHEKPGHDDWPNDETPPVDLSKHVNANSHMRSCKCTSCNQPEPVWSYQLLRSGGPWLGAARGRIKWIPGGDRVTWGSSDEMTLTVAQIEEIAAHAAAAAYNEGIKHARDFYTSPVGREAIAPGGEK